MTILSISVLAEPINIKKAARLALPFMSNQLEEPILVKKAVRRNTKKMAVNLQEAAPYYIYSRGNDKGFVIISGDDALPEILGYTESGDFDESNLPPFLEWYLDYYGRLAETCQDAGAERMDTKKYAAAGRVDIKPLMTTHWNQGEPYNNLCPTLKENTKNHCVTGCVATAAAQILNYWKKDLPAYTQASTTSYSGDKANATTAFPKGTPMKWDLMRDSYSTEPAEYKEAVATLMAVVGGAARLSYGSSTSGYTDDIVGVNSTYFKMNGGKCYVKDRGGSSNDYSDDAWATMLYNELLLKHPIMYSGVKDGENGGGHAVVVDGYQASTGLFHFNLGWGGSSDGYYTTNRGKSPSWGFNDSWQQCIIGAYPKMQNLKGSIITPSIMYKNRVNTVKVKVSNNGTLPYSGIYLHGNTTGKVPTSLGSAKDIEKDTELNTNGSEYLFQMEVKPTSDKYYLFVTDKNLNVIASCSIQTTEPESELIFNGINVCGSSESQDGYTIVYNEKTTAEATLINTSDAAYEGTVKANIYCSSDGGQNFRFIGYKSTKAEIPANGEGKAVFSIVSSAGCPIMVDSLYRVVMNMETPSNNTPLVIAEGADSVAGFILKGADMEVLGFENGCVSFEGHWDPLLFNTTIKKTAYKTATTYDLTQVTSIDEIPESPVNPNALFYVNDPNAKGYANIVYGDECNKLLLTPGYDFVPKSEFNASQAIVNISQVPNKWYLFTAPCDLDVPKGMLARVIDSHTSSGISNKTTNVDKLDAGKTYLLISTSANNQLLTGQYTHVASCPSINVDTALKGRFENSTTPAGSFLIDMEQAQYFQPVEKGTPIEALRGFFCASNVKKAFKAYSNVTQDPTYQTLGEAIQNAYDKRDVYQDIVFDFAFRQLTDSIIKAETVYSAREMANADVKALTTRLNEMVRWYITQISDPSITPIDYTSYIVNPSFETGNTDGWTINATNYVSVRSTSNVSYKGVGADGSYLLYSIKSSNLSGCGISQTIEGLPAGYYKLTAMLGSGLEKKITMFANDSVVTIDSHPFGQFYLTEAKIENIYIPEGKALTIGIQDGSWYKADDFRLYYTATDPTGIEDITPSDTRPIMTKTYDVSGRVVGDSDTLKRGIYIKNGKKIFVR